MSGVGYNITMTPFDTRVQIVSDFWMLYRDEEEFKDLIDYADLGLPLAWLIASGWVEPKEQAINIINDTFDLLLSICTGNSEDAGFETIDDLMDLKED